MKHAARTRLQRHNTLADIKQCIDAPQYTYSAGMSVGDKDFQKNLTKIERFYKQKKTTITASHVMRYLKEYYNQTMVIEIGKMIL